MDERIYFTKRGWGKLKKEIVKLTKKIVELQSQTAYVAEIGGDQYHDNASYEMLTIDIRGIDHRLSEAHHHLNKAILVEVPKNTERVSIGTRVDILKNEKEETWEIAGFGESDASRRIIAYNTLLASLLIGKREGDIVNGIIAGKHTKIEILKISMGGNNEDTE